MKSLLKFLSLLNRKTKLGGGIIFRYIFKELFLYFIVCFLFFFFIFFVNQILLMAEEILSKKAPLKDVALLMFYSLPFIIATAAPYAALVGTLMGLGRFVSDLEFVSMNALGISSFYMLIPVFALGLFISIISFITNDIFLPWGSVKFNEVYFNLATSTPALELESFSIKRGSNTIVIAGLIKDNVVNNILIVDKTSDDETKVLGSSKTVIEKSDSPSIVMKLNILNPRMLSLDLQDRTKYGAAYGECITYNVLAEDIKYSFAGSMGPDKMTSLDLYRDIKNKIKENASERTLNIYMMEFNKKFSIPFGAFFFVMLAAAISGAGRLHNQSVGFVLGLLISVSYWAILMGGQTLALNRNLNGSLAMWLPNIMLFSVAIFFFIKKVFQ
ncbi:MAG: LptF/LptG family permease [Treponema sp.]